MKSTELTAEAIEDYYSSIVNRRIGGALASFDQLHTLTAGDTKTIAPLVEQALVEIYVTAYQMEAEAVGLTDYDIEAVLAAAQAFVGQKVFGMTTRARITAHLADWRTDIKAIDRAAKKQTEHSIPPEKPAQMVPRQQAAGRAAVKQNTAAIQTTRGPSYSTPQDESKQEMMARTGRIGESGVTYQMQRILRTEGNAAQAEASLQVYRDAGIHFYRYCAILDSKTCTECQLLDGRIIPVEDAVRWKTVPPRHANCRCWLEPIKNEKQIPRATPRAKGEDYDPEHVQAPISTSKGTHDIYDTRTTAEWALLKEKYADVLHHGD